MLIHLPVVARIGSEIRISARIDFKEKSHIYPSTLWFRFPAAYSSEISADADPFAVALLLLAMQNREPLEIAGSISQKLLLGMEKYQQIYHSWYSERFHLIEIRASQVRSTEATDLKRGTACAFSGGVDSFYTLLSLSTKTTHALFMAGFDMPLNLKASIRELTQSYSALMKDLGIRFVIGSTNIRNFVNTVDWTNAHGQALAASALFFKDTWNQFFIPSSYNVNTHPKWGTHPLLDPLLSTENLEFIHHGAESNRIDKLSLMIQNPSTYNRLRVCWIQDIGLKNCGQCEKCIRTMIALDILDSLHLYTTFDTSKSERRLSRKKIYNLPQRTYQARLFARELMWASFCRRKYQICFDLGYSLIRRLLLYSIKKIFINS